MHPRTDGRRRRGGFTLVELLVVIGIIGVLMALLLPAVQASRESARNLRCKNNLRQLSTSLLNYVTSMGAFPPSYQDNRMGCNGSSAPADNAPGFAWSALLLPFVEQTGLWDSLQNGTSNCTVNWQSAGSAVTSLAQKSLEMFECSSNQTYGTPNTKRVYVSNGAAYGRINYGPNSGTYAVFMLMQDLADCFGFTEPGAKEAEWRRCVGVFTVSDKNVNVTPAAIRDGLSTTMMLAERSSTVETGGSMSCGGEPCDPAGGLWIGPSLMPGQRGWSSGLINHDVETYGGDAAWSIYMINRSSAAWADDWINGSPHAGGGMNASMCDGSVRWISENILQSTHAALRSRMNGEAVIAE